MNVSLPPVTLPTPNKRKTRRSVKNEDDEFDILYIDDCVRNLLSNRVKTIDSLREELSVTIQALEDMKNVRKSQADEKKLRVSKTQLKKKIVDVELQFEYNYYILQTNDLIQEYKELKNKSKTLSFLSNHVKNNKDTIRESEIIVEYMSRAKQFFTSDELKDVRIDYVQKPNIVKCKDCGNMDDITSENGILYTCSCGSIISYLDQSPIYSDTERINVSSRFHYTCKQYFITAINNYEGVENVTIGNNIIPCILDQMNLLDITKEKLTKDQLYMILKENGMSNMYEHINLLYSMITGKACPNITRYRQDLYKRIDEMQSVYMDVKEEDRTNSLHVIFKLYKCLQIVGYNKCTMNDFYILSTPSKLEEHEEKWKEMIEVLKVRYPNRGWRYIPTR